MSGHVMFCSTEKENICTHCIGFFFSPNKIARDVNDDISYLEVKEGDSWKNEK